jgi:hypothetical protein
MAGLAAPRNFLNKFKPKSTRRERREKRSEFTGGDIEAWTRENAGAVASFVVRRASWSPK